MSLEDLLKENTAALNRNSDLLEGITNAAKANLKNSTATPKDEVEKPASKPRAKATDKPAKAPTVKEVTDQTKEFLEVDSDDEYNERRAFVKKIVGKFGAEKMSELEEGDRRAALDYLVAYKAGDATDLDEEEDEKPRRRDDDV